MQARFSPRRLALLLALAAPLCHTAAWSADAKPAAAATGTAVSTAPQAQAAKPSAGTECPQGANERAGSNKPSSKSETGTQGAGVKAPPKPKCPQDMVKKVATPQ